MSKKECLLFFRSIFNFHVGQTDQNRKIRKLIFETVHYMFLHVSSKKKLVFSLKIRSSDWFSEKKIHSKKRVSKLENFWMRSEFLKSFQNMSELMSIALILKKNLWNRKSKSSSCHTNAYFFQKWEKSLRNGVTLFSEWIIFFRSKHSFFLQWVSLFKGFEKPKDDEFYHYSSEIVQNNF